MIEITNCTAERFEYADDFGGVAHTAPPGRGETANRARTPQPLRIRRMFLKIAKLAEAQRAVEVADLIRHEAEEHAYWWK